MLLSDGTEVPYDALIVATGVRPRQLPGTPAPRHPGTPAHTLHPLDDALALKARLGAGRSLAVVGAGFLGAEPAAVAVDLGTRTNRAGHRTDIDSFSATPAEPLLYQ
ncbi:putative Ferredoxin reductase [Streptomyces viridochromogenes Tue57]|uniref:Putative Ferredoxin reductase n=1 Tax=Streptomyces viridochromogenes Tue57 TaxID=1160705 RepID=L8P771_STRVR|nr:putative Ferredoxin reductase [Streptomyces viridochromogenes Tue57]